MIKEKNYVYTDMDAIWSLVGNNVSHPYNSERIYHDGQTPPTEEEIKTEKTRLQAEYEANQYQRDRQYPELGEQLDMLFHDMTVGKGTKDGEWYKAVAKVKSDNPKPE